MKTFSQIIRNYWVDLVLLNLAFLLGCIPVVTIPASLSALSRALLRMQREENVHIFRVFFRDVKTGFVRSLLPGCILLAGLALSGKILICEDISGRVPLLVFLLLWIYAVFSFSMYAIPLAAQLDLPLGVVLRNALILLLARSGQNVAALLVVAASTLLLVLTAPFLLPLALFAHFSFCALVCLCFAKGGLRRCIAE